MQRDAVYVEIHVACSMEKLWELTQSPSQHSRWDLRFSLIEPIDDLADGGYRFRYERRLPLHTIVGTGTAIGEKVRPDGTRTSALRFTTADRLSPLGSGRGYWRYEPTDTGVRFITGYTYSPGWGRLADRLLLNRIIGWMTAWSFDRLRIWAESGTEPERLPVRSVLQFWRTDRPRASRCLRRPERGRPMDVAPATLETLEAP